MPYFGGTRYPVLFGGGASVPSLTVLLSTNIVDEVNTFTRFGKAGYTGATGAAFAYEAAVDTLRSAHYVAGEPTVILETNPTVCTPGPPTSISVTPTGVNFSGSFTAPIGSPATYEWRLDGTGSWFATDSAGTATTFSGSDVAGNHTVDVRAKSSIGTAGTLATSPSFTLTGSPAAPNVEIIPTADTATGTWTVLPLFSKVDENIASPNTGDSISQTDVNASTPCVLAFTLPGGSVSKVRVNTYGVSGGTSGINVSVSQDNVTYPANQALAMTGSTATRSVLFSALGWTAPTVCHVRLDGSGNTFQSQALYTVSITINEP